MIQDKYIIWSVIIIILFFALYKNIKKEEKLSNLFDKEINKKQFNFINKKNIEKIELNDNNNDNNSVDSSIRYTYIYDKINYDNYDGYRNDEYNRDKKRQVRFNLDKNTFHQ
jgi:hypothetical protein